MAQATMSNGDTSSIFRSGSIFSQLGKTAISAFDQVAPVWLAQQLNLDKAQPVAVAPTFQTTANNQPTGNLTSTTGDQQKEVFGVRQETLILIGGGVLVVGALIFLKD